MKAKIMMWVEGKAYEYGMYDFNTPEEKNRVNELAMRIGEERGCHTYVERMEK